MAIHIPTMFLMIIAASATLAFSVGWAAYHTDKDGLQIWTGALVLHTLGFSLLTLQDQIPDLFSVLLGNVALSSTYALLLAAIAKFQQRHIAPSLLWGPPLMVACTLSVLMSNISGQIIGSGLIFVVQILMVFFALRSRRFAITGRGKHLIICGVVIMIATLIMRIFNAAFSAEKIQSITRETPVQILTFLAGFITLILVSNGFVMMTKERADERTRLLSMKDRLTDTWNRVRIEEVAQIEMARLERYGHPVSLIMIDLDHFKDANDQFGHAAGDQVLKEFTAIAQSCIRTTDVLGRWGGEEFLVLLPNSGFSSTAQLAERIRSTLEQHTFVGGHKLTASFGFSVCQSTDTWDSWLNRADMALYRAKAKGRNQVETESLELNTNKAELLDANFVELVWHRAYESGHSQIDTQHRILFDHANNLLRAVIGKQKKQEITLLISTLTTEIQQHFNDEETVFRAVAFPEATRHCDLHQRLIMRANQLAEHFENDQLGVGELFHYLAYEVVAQHMLIEDRKFFPLLVI